jgi:uncharacterized protein (TIGR00725 family)
MRRRLIAVIGAAEADEAVLSRAREVGRRLAEAGEALVTGGLGGVMAAASEGAARAGGTVLAILPGGSPDEANPWVELAVATGCGDARNAMIANSADGFVAVAGSWGTLSEIAFALKRGKPVVALDAPGELPVHRAGTPEEAVRVLLGLLSRARPG